MAEWTATIKALAHRFAGQSQARSCLPRYSGQGESGVTTADAASHWRFG